MEKTYQSSNINIFYRVEGEGDVVVLLHGFAEDGHVWDEQIDSLKTHCKVFVPDLPGSGKSGMLHTAPGISDYAECIHILLQHENISQCIMLGHSMGGYITLAYSEKYPDTLKALGLINSTAFADSENKKQNRLRGIEAIKQSGSAAFIRNLIPNLFGEKFKTSHPEKINALAEAGKYFLEEALEQYYLAMMNRPDRTHVLRNSNLPVLFVVGTEDVAVGLSDVLQQVYLPETGFIHILESTGHMSMLEATEKVNEFVSDFVREVGKL